MLGGTWQAPRGCHIGGDFLLACKIDRGVKPALIVFVRAGAQADVFE
jgi:mRNA interferase YafQ